MDGVRVVARQPARDHVAHSLADVHAVIADPLVEPSDQRELHGHLQLDLLGGVALEDLSDEVDLQPVEDVVHVVERGGERHVGVDVRVDREAEELRRLLAHLSDHPSQPRVELHSVEAPRPLADVHGEVAGALDLADHLDRGHDLPEVAGHRCLQREQLVALLLELDAPGVDLVVGADQVLGALEVTVEQHLRRPRDRLETLAATLCDSLSDLVELLVELLAKIIGHETPPQPKRPVT